MKKVEEQFPITLDSGYALLGGSLTMFAGGAILGARHMMKREKFVFGFRSEFVGLATRAFLYGTALCLTSFGLGTAIFVKTTNIRTPKELRKYMNIEFNKYDIVKPKEELVDDIQNKNNMSVEEEEAYWWDVFFAPRSAEEKEINEKVQSEIDSLQKSRKEKEGLSFYDQHFNKPVDPNDVRQSLWDQWMGKEPTKKNIPISTPTSSSTDSSMQTTIKLDKENKDEFVVPGFLEEKERESLYDRWFKK